MGKPKNNGYSPQKYQDNREYYLAAAKKYREANPAKVRGSKLLASYGITLDDYNEMLLAQGGVCAICKKPELMVRKGKIRILAVDHCHATGKVRALLCYRCNSILGFVEDSPETLRIAAAYLEEHRG